MSEKTIICDVLTIKIIFTFILIHSIEKANEIRTKSKINHLY